MQMAALALGPEIFGYGFRLLPTPEEAVTYYLPRLVAGKPLHDAVRPVVHHADVYASAPADLARHFRPLPRTGDRFFFTPKRAPGAAQASRGGSWQAQNKVDIKARGGDEGAKVGELRKLRYKNRGGGGYTDWLMDEYSSCSGDDESQFVLCKMYVSPRAAPTSAARRESAAYFFTLPPPPPAALAAAFMQPAPVAAPKRPAPPRPAMSPPCAKKMRGQLLARPAQQPPAPPGPTVSPPQPCAPRHNSTTPLSTQPSPASAPPAPPPAPTRTPLAAVQTLSFAPQQPCAPRFDSKTPLATQPSPASALPLAPLVPIRPAIAMQPHCTPHKVPLLPTPPVARSSCHVPVQSKQRRILDPFEAAMLRDEAEEQTLAAAPHPPPPAAATPALQDQDEDEDDWGDLDKALEILDDETGSRSRGGNSG